MKKLSGILILCLLMLGCKPQTYNSPDGSVPSAFVPYVEPFLGTYQTGRGLVQLTMDDHGFVKLAINFDVSGQNCAAKIGVLQTVQVYGQTQAPFDADFALDVGSCQWLPTRVATFHFNRTLTGANVFQLTVLLKERTNSSQGGTEPEYKTWSLTKTSSL